MKKTSLILALVFIVISLCFFKNLMATPISTSLSGFGNFINGSPGYANPATKYTTYNLQGFQPHHPSCGQYNANGSLMVTHGGSIYSTADGSLVATSVDNKTVSLKQWSNIDPNTFYCTTGSNATKNVISNGKITTTVLFDLASAKTFFGVSFSSFYGGSLEGSCIVGPDKAIAIFGIEGANAHMLIWKIGTGWLKDHITIPWDNFDLYCAAPISDPKIADNLGYVWVKPIDQGNTNNGNVAWVIVTVTSTGATSKINSQRIGAHHASMCVWQDTDSSFNPGLIDIYGSVLQQNGKYFSIGSSWGGSMHLGWIRGTIYALGENSSNGANAMALRKSNQGGYQVLANGSSSGNTSYAGCYSKDGIVNVNYKNPSSSGVQMRMISYKTPDPISIKNSIVIKDLNKGISIYKSSANSNFTINNLTTNSIISIFSINGRLITKERAYDNFINCNTVGWNKGMYVLQIKSDMDNFVKKIIVK